MPHADIVDTHPSLKESMAFVFINIFLTDWGPEGLEILVFTSYHSLLRNVIVLYFRLWVAFTTLHNLLCHVSWLLIRHQIQPFMASSLLYVDFL